MSFAPAQILSERLEAGGVGRIIGTLLAPIQSGRSEATMAGKGNWRSSGVSRREVMRLGAGGLGFGLFGGIGPVPYVLQPGEQVAPRRRRRARSSWCSSGSAATTG